MKITRLAAGFIAVGGVAAAVVALASCRLYEPERYERLAPPAGVRSIRILMIGDSLTYYNDLPGLLQQFSAREAHPIYIEKNTFPLAGLGVHWNIGPAVERIREGHWDYVVLQDYSRKPVTDPEDCVKYYELFSGEAGKAGAKAIIFENWTRWGMDDEFGALAATYERIVERTGGRAAPIGAAFRSVRAARPDIGLLIDDRHPTDAGTYLAACVLYDVVYGKGCSALPWDLAGPRLSREVMATLRAHADRAMQLPGG